MSMGSVGIWLLVDIEGGWNELVSWGFDVLFAIRFLPFLWMRFVLHVLLL